MAALPLPGCTVAIDGVVSLLIRATFDVAVCGPVRVARLVVRSSDRYARCMTKQIAVRIPDEALAAIDAAVADGRFPNRTAAVLAGIESLLREERRRAIEEADRR